jgi:DNA-binding transcriptional regulator GbsR (MarR family)
VSGAVRYLIQVDLVRPAGEPGSRRLSYSVPGDVWEQLITLRNATMIRFADVLREGAERLGRDSPAGERVAESARFFAFVADDTPRVLARWTEYNSGTTPPA